MDYLTDLEYWIQRNCIFGPIQTILYRKAKNFEEVGNYKYIYAIPYKNNFIGNKLVSPYRRYNRHSFAYLKILKYVIINKNAVIINNYCFENCKNLKYIVIPNKVESIGKIAFSNCNKLVLLSIPKSIESIGQLAFSACLNLRKIIFHDDCCINKFSNGLFHSCNNLTEITIPNNVYKIEYSAFAYCSSLITITIPDSVTSIGNYAFANCKNLKSISIPNHLKDLEDVYPEKVELIVR
jgi:hypothetical protein